MVDAHALTKKHHSSFTMTQAKDNPEPRQDLLPKGYLWKKGANPEDPSSPPQTAPEAGEIDPRLDTSRQPPEHLPKLEGKLEPSKFQTNFPQQQQQQRQHGGQASVTEAVKTIKPEDFLNVTQRPCARNGFISGIITGGLVGGIRFVMNSQSNPHTPKSHAFLTASWWLILGPRN